MAEHSFRAALIGYFLAKEEGADGDRVIKMLLFHDLPESRIGDIHKVAGKYLNKPEAESEVIKDQKRRMPGEMGEEYQSLLQEFEKRESKEAVVARDADLIECSVQAKEYMEKGYSEAENWIENAGKEIETETAKEMLNLIVEKYEPWWKGLKEV